ncbi:hypothetical protein DMENIID0001_120400 [Sergentomyia squamirostris]
MAADAGMDTCPSPEIADSRKRPLDGDSENGNTKRSHFSTETRSMGGVYRDIVKSCRRTFHGDNLVGGAV